MLAVVLNHHGTLSDVQVTDIPIRDPEPSEVRIKVHAAALNHLDLFVTTGWPGLHLQFPHILGSDVAGIVDEVGKNVTAWKPGDEVVVNPLKGCGKCSRCLEGEDNLCEDAVILGEQIRGTFAEFAYVDSCQVFKKPKHLSFEEAAAFPLTFVTAWRMLVTLAQIKPDQHVLIQGIGGGVAVAALQICQALRARTIVTSRHFDKRQWALDHGAVKAFDSGDRELAKTLRDQVVSEGVDVVLDSVGKATWPQSLRSLKRGGKLVTCGATTGGNVSAEIERVFWNQLQILGSTMGSTQDFTDMLTFVEKHRITPEVSRTFALEEAKEALAFLDAGKQLGKVVLKVTR